MVRRPTYSIRLFLFCRWSLGTALGLRGLLLLLVYPRKPQLVMEGSGVCVWSPSRGLLGIVFVTWRRGTTLASGGLVWQKGGTLIFRKVKWLNIKWDHENVSYRANQRWHTRKMIRCSLMCPEGWKNRSFQGEEIDDVRKRRSDVGPELSWGLRGCWVPWEKK